MFRMSVRTNTNRYPQDVISLDTTPQEVLDQKGVSTQGATVSLNGRILSYADFDTTFRDMGIQEGSEAILHTVVKATSAR